MSTDDDNDEGEKTYAHPSYGMISLHRTQVGGKGARLFGSSMKGHHQIMTLEICEAERRHHLSQDWYHAGKSLIRIELSATQFAEFITSSGIGGGVPCTIGRLHGKQVADPPEDEKIEAEQVRDDFEKKAKGIAKDAKKRAKEIEAILAKSSVSKKAAAEIMSHLRMIAQEIESNLPFVLDQFNEAADKVVTAAKGEIEAHVLHTVVNAGLEALLSPEGRARLGTKPVAQLPQLIAERIKSTEEEE